MNEALEFYKQYKDTSISIKPLPNGDLEDQARWILSGNGYQWVELDTEFNIDSWKKEAKLADSYYVPHRDIFSGEGTHQGWESCTLHGIDTDKTNVWQTYGYNVEPEYKWTELGEACTNIKKYFKQTFPSETYARIRFMKLQPNGCISPHNDYSPVINMEKILDMPLPVNIAIDHPENCKMTLQDHGCVPFENGKMFMVNIFNNHSVVNWDNYPRIHMIVHCNLGNKKKEFCELLVRSYKKQHDYYTSL
jgi:hypothetical protein